MNKLDSSFVGYTISSATLRLQDLIPAGLGFMAEFDKEGLQALNDEYLDDLNVGLAKMPVEKWHKGLIYTRLVSDNYIYQLKSLDEIGGLPDDHPLWSYDWEGDILSWLWHEDIFERLNSIAPAGCYFGSHMGDGALIGFWV